MEMKTQDDTLSGQVSSVDVATKKNLNDLLEVGEGLLKKPVSRVNLENGRFEVCNHETNEEALIRYTSTNIYYVVNFSNISSIIFYLKMQQINNIYV